MSKVSVCIPVYNPNREFLRASVESILQQEYPDFELLLVDDYSTSLPDGLFEEFSDPRVRLHRNPRNYGLPGNWSRCVELAQGEYITIFHQDDLMYPRNLSCKAEMLDRYPSVGLVYSDIWNLDEDGQKVARHPARISDDDQILTCAEVASMVGRYVNFIACPSVVVRKSCYERLGVFDPRLSYSSDFEMWLRIAKVYDIGFIGEPLVGRRVHQQQASTKFWNDGSNFVEMMKALDIAFTDWPTPGYAPHARAAHLLLARWAGFRVLSRLRRMKLAQAARFTTLMFTAWRRARSFSSHAPMGA